MPPRRTLARSVLLGLAGLVGVVCAAAAETVPLPQVPFSATARISDMAKPARVYHRDGTLRIEASGPQGPMVMLIDLKTREGTLLAAMGAMKVAMPLPAGTGPLNNAAGLPTGDKVGTDKVAGEACTLWQWRDPGSGESGRSCITGDGIPLRTTVRNGSEIVLSDVQRTAQPEGLFVVPEGYQRITIPQGNLPGLPGKN